MEGRLVSIRGMSSRDIAAWQELSECAAEPNPLFEPRCLLPAAQHLPRGEDMQLLVAEEDGSFFGCAPVLRRAASERPSASWHGVFRPSLSTQVRRNRYDGTPLVRAERGVEAFISLLEAAGEARGHKGAGLLVFESFRWGGETSAALVAAARQLGMPLEVVHSYERPVVFRASEGDGRRQHSPKSRQNWARQERQLGEKLGGQVQLVDRSDDVGAVEELLQLEAAGYKGLTEGRRHRYLDAGSGGRGGAFLCWPGEGQWFRELCNSSRRESKLVLYSLEVANTPVAMNLMLRAGAGLFLLVTVFDESYERYSPGVLLHLKAIEHFDKALGAEWVDSCTYEGNETLMRLYQDRRLVVTTVVGVGGRADRAAFAAYMFGQRTLGAGSPLRKSKILTKALDWAVSNLLPR